MTARDRPPSCLRQGRVRGRTGQAALLPAARAGAWPHRTSRLLAYGKGGCVAARNKPLSCLRQGRVRGRTGQAAFLPAARAGAWPHRTSRLLAYGKGGCVAARDRPPSCLRQGRVRGRTGQAAFLPTARAESAILQLGGNTRACMEDPYCLLAWRRGGVVRSWDSLRGRLPPRPPGGGCAPFQPL